jgi:hypothetical protein
VPLFLFRSSRLKGAHARRVIILEELCVVLALANFSGHF